MGIKFYCDACERKLNVKAFLAGKRGVCPHCGASIKIPTESKITSKQQPAKAADANGSSGAAAAGAAAPVATAAPMARAVASTQAAPVATPVAAPRQAPPTPDPISESPASVWYVRPPTGGQYGPAKGDVMRRWVGEGRVSGDSLVWREGWADWQSAEKVFPELAGSVAQPIAASPSGNGPPGGDVLTTGVKPSPRTLKSGRGKKRNTGLAIFAIVLLTLLSIGLLVALFVILGGVG